MIVFLYFNFLYNSNCHGSYVKILDMSDSDEYRRLLRFWFQAKPGLDRLEFEKQIRLILKTPEQIKAHNKYIISILIKAANGL